MKRMEQDRRVATMGKNGELIDGKGEILVPPSSWVFLPAGDAGITRKVTAKGLFWKVEVKMGRRMISRGIWAPAAVITQAVEEVEAARLTDEYKKKRVSAVNNREKKQALYETDFYQAVVDYLNFDAIYKALGEKLATAVTAHAVPVGSGTVARTQRIPVNERAAHAVIAWMRHKTTAYDNLKIDRIKGERRAVRRLLAQQSVALLANYRQGSAVPDDCPLKRAVENR